MTVQRDTFSHQLGVSSFHLPLLRKARLLIKLGSPILLASLILLGLMGVLGRQTAEAEVSASAVTAPPAPSAAEPVNQAQALAQASALKSAGPTDGRLFDKNGIITPNRPANQPMADPPPDYLSILKSVNASTADPGDTITYTLVFTNAGPMAAPSATITDTLPISITVQGTASQGDMAITHTLGAPGLEVFEIAEIQPGQGGTITIIGRIDNALTERETLTNTATIDTPQHDTNPLVNTDTAALIVCVGPPETTTVTNADDDGPGSLRQAISEACNGDTITFDANHTIWVCFI